MLGSGVVGRRLSAPPLKNYLHTYPDTYYLEEKIPKHGNRSIASALNEPKHMTSARRAGHMLLIGTQAKFHPWTGLLLRVAIKPLLGFSRYIGKVPLPVFLA